MDEPFVTAYGPNGQKRWVPEHYLDNPAFAFKRIPSERARTDDDGDAVTPISATEPAPARTRKQIKEPASPATTKEASE